jgi:CMP-N-acetylneuraminic acid synthetase
VSVNEQYYPNGAFYIIRKDVFLREETFWVSGMGIYIMKNRVSVDIDNLWDLKISEALYKGLMFTDEVKKDALP